MEIIKLLYPQIISRVEVKDNVVKIGKLEYSEFYDPLVNFTCYLLEHGAYKHIQKFEIFISPNMRKYIKNRKDPKWVQLFDPFAFRSKAKFGEKDTGLYILDHDYDPEFIYAFGIQRRLICNLPREDVLEFNKKSLFPMLNYNPGFDHYDYNEGWWIYNGSGDFITDDDVIEQFRENIDPVGISLKYNGVLNLLDLAFRHSPYHIFEEIYLLGNQHLSALEEYGEVEDVVKKMSLVEIYLEEYKDMSTESIELAKYYFDDFSKEDSLWITRNSNYDAVKLLVKQCCLEYDEWDHYCVFDDAVKIGRLDLAELIHEHGGESRDDDMMKIFKSWMENKFKNEFTT